MPSFTVSDGRHTHGPVKIPSIGHLPKYLAAYVRSKAFYPRTVTVIGDKGGYQSLSVKLEGGFIKLSLMRANPRRRRNPIPVEVAGNLDYQTQIPSQEEFQAAVANTPGAKMTEKGLELTIERWQKPEQGTMPSLRSAVFYLPAGAAAGRYYRKADAWYGGTEHIKGTTLIRRPLFVKGATGGKVPEKAYETVAGKGSVKKLDADILSGLVLRGSQSRWDLVPQVEALIESYGADPSLAPTIVEFSPQGNTLRYALRELIMCSAARKAGYDSILGWSKGKSGPFFSEVIDLREDVYPFRGDEGQVHESFERKMAMTNPLAHLRPAPRLTKGAKRQLPLGTRVEMEHTRSKKTARLIATHHLAECPTYYSRLVRMERSCKRSRK